MTSGGNSFNDFHEIVPNRENTTKIEKTFLFLVRGRGPIYWMGLCCSTHLNPALKEHWTCSRISHANIAISPGIYRGAFTIGDAADKSAYNFMLFCAAYTVLLFVLYNYVVKFHCAMRIMCTDFSRHVKLQVAFKAICGAVLNKWKNMSSLRCR